MSNFTSCSTGVYDCNYDGIPASQLSSCADYNDKYNDMENVSWTVIVAAIIMCVMAFGIGSNDAANSWATSVGSGAIKLRTALILGAICEFSGTVLLGSGVAKTIKEDISNIENEDCWACGYCDSKMSLFQAGMLASLMSTAVFLLLSSFTSMPVSATHAVVGGVAGMTMGTVGTSCVDWSFSGMGALMASWVISPLLAGIISVVVFYVTKRYIVDSAHPRERIVPKIPYFVTFIAMIMTFLVCIKSEDLKDLGYPIQLGITGIFGIITLIASYIFLLPWIRRNMPTAVNDDDYVHTHHYDCVTEGTVEGGAGSGGDVDGDDASASGSRILEPALLPDSDNNGIMLTDIRKLDTISSELGVSGSRKRAESLESGSADASGQKTAFVAEAAASETSERISTPRSESFRLGLGVGVQFVSSTYSSEHGGSQRSHSGRSSPRSRSNSLSKTDYVLGAAETTTTTTMDNKVGNGDIDELGGNNKGYSEEALSAPLQPPTELDDAMFCFRVLLVFSAALKSFAHGANDTANATGPFSAVLEIHDYGLDICSDDSRRSPIWVMVMAGVFVALGILMFGHKVITTVGEKLVVIDYHSGFCIELGSCVSVVLATQLGIPVSTTHCQIGAVVGAGLMASRREGEEKVHWGLIAKIALTWVITVPVAGLLSVGLVELLRPAFK